MTDVYEIITDQVVKALESGKVPWRQPWNVAENGPRNLNGRPYRGMNVFLLLATGRKSPYWMTFNQIKKGGGRIVKGEPGSIVVFWKLTKVADPVTGVEKTIPLLRYYKVWNLEQVTGIEPPKKATLGTNHFDPIEAAEDVVKNYPSAPTIVHSGNQANYRWDSDTVTIPRRGQFSTAHEYYSTVFHELTHSTGHADRLNRKLQGYSPETAHAYGREELIAEMGAAFLSGETGILPKTIDNTAAYLRSWIKTIKADPRAVVVAAGAAQRAADHILNRTKPDFEEESE